MQERTKSAAVAGTIAIGFARDGRGGLEVRP